MDKLLRQFLADGEELMRNAPLDFFESYKPRGGSGCGGVHIAWFIEWCARNDLLSNEVSARVHHFHSDGMQSNESFCEFCRRITAGVLKPEHFSDDGARFARTYYSTGWRHRYFDDIEASFPDVEFGDLIDSHESRALIFDLMSKRFSEFNDEQAEKRKC